MSRRSKRKSLEDVAIPRRSCFRRVASAGLVGIGIVLAICWKWEECLPAEGTGHVQNATVVDRITDLMRAAQTGNAAKVKEMVAKIPDVETEFRKVDRSGWSLMHFALAGRMLTLDSQSERLVGNHEAVIELLASHHMYDNCLQCPIYYAVHYRNMAAVRSLIKHTQHKERLVECLLRRDTYGSTAIHASSKSKASGFARFFLRLVDPKQSQVRNPQESRVLQLLGLQLPQLSKSGRLTYASLTRAILPVEIETIFNLQNINTTAMINAKDSHGNSPLHLASLAGRWDLIRLLLSKGASADSKNNAGQTPLHMAVIAMFPRGIQELLSNDKGGLKTEDSQGRTPSGWHGGIGLIQAALTEVGITSGETKRMSQIELHKWEADGWATSQREAQLIVNAPGSCQIDLWNQSNLPQAHFLDSYLALRKPVFLRWPKHVTRTRTAWQKQRFLQKYGDVVVTMAPIPYSDLYGFKDTQRIKIRDYVKTYMTNKTIDGVPPYIFDGKVLQENKDLEADLDLPDIITAHPAILKQFIMGPPGSGAPPHFHGNAFNMLISGKKQWYFYPPPVAYVSTIPVVIWANKDLQRDLNEGIVLSCTQMPGDIVYVPENWGHAVINVENSLAVALEVYV